MRYENWDVILFPRDSLVPMQEFRTACYASQDDHGRQLHTLNCYITSLPASTPFRISVHSWAAPANPSQLIESRRKPNQRVVYTAQVVVDGARVFHGLYEVGSKWPQEIVSKKRSITDPTPPANQRGPFLEFPPFHQNLLMQSSWDAREVSGRIKILLSEQLMRKSHNPSEMDLGASNDIVCFAFQHAPRDILEQSGIAWPVRNPLYMPSWTASRPISSSGSQQLPASAFTKGRHFAPPMRPRTDPPAQFSQWPKPPSRMTRHGVWDPSMQDAFGEGNFDATSMGSWTKTTQSLDDVSMPDMYAGAFAETCEPWETMPPSFDTEDGGRQKGARQVVVTLREDQLGQLIEAISPPKKASTAQSSQRQAPPPKMAPLSTRPSAASMARKTSYHDLTKPDKEDRQPGQKAPHMFSNAHSQYERWDSDVSMRDLSSTFSTAVPAARRPSPAHIPETGGLPRSRKEGQRHDASLPPPHTLEDGNAGHALSKVKVPFNTPNDSFGPGPASGHKQGMSSVDSTARLERQLFSALGEELSGLAQASPPSPPELGVGELDMGYDGVGEDGGGGGGEDATSRNKRKRQGGATTCGARHDGDDDDGDDGDEDDDGSPVAKMVSLREEEPLVCFKVG